MKVTFTDSLPWLALQKNTPLIGRAQELQLAQTLFRRVLQEEPSGAHTLFIQGDRGIGKSRLLEEIYRQALDSGFQVLAGHAYAAKNFLPYSPFIEILQPFLRSCSHEQLIRYLDLARTPSPSLNDSPLTLAEKPLIAMLARLFPTILERLKLPQIPEALSQEQEKRQLFDALAILLDRIAQEQPLLLSIDNIQWADSSSRELCLYLAVRLHKNRIALIGTARPSSTYSSDWEEIDHLEVAAVGQPMSKGLMDLERQGLLLFLPLGPLDRASATQYLDQLLPAKHDPYLLHVLLERAEGNPFFLEELVRTLVANHNIYLHEGVWQASRAVETLLPTNILLAVKQRLQELHSSCLDALRSAALFGRSFPLYALQAVLEKTVTDLAWLDEAVQAGILTLVPTPLNPIAGRSDTARFLLTDEIALHRSLPRYIFCQGIMQEVLRLELPASSLQVQHRAISRALEDYYSSDREAHAAELAYHALLGGAKAVALHWNLLAGQQAARQLAHREAIAHFQVCLKLLAAGEQETDAPTPALLSLTIGELWFKLGEFTQAEQALLSALPLLNKDTRSAEESLRLSQVNRYLSDIYRMLGRFDLTMSHLQAAHAAIIDTFPPVGEAGEANYVITTVEARGRTFSLAQRTGHTRQADIAEHIQLLQSQATLDILLRRVKEAREALWKSHQLATNIGDRSSQAFALHFIGYLCGWGEHIHDAIRFQEQALHLYISLGDPFRAVLGEQLLGVIYHALGESVQAQKYSQEGFDRAQQHGVATHLGWFYWNFSVSALIHGQWDAVAQHLQEAEQHPAPRIAPILWQTRGILAFRQGDWQQARHAFQESIQSGIYTEWYPSTLAFYAYFLAVTGQHVEARTQLERAVAAPEAPGYAGDFYIPFLAEAFLHMEMHETAATYTERLRKVRGFIYYGYTVDRILGLVAAHSSGWQEAEQAFSDGLALCRRSDNRPEEASILYEQARVALMQSATYPLETKKGLLGHVKQLCSEARAIFQAYHMQRSIDLVDTLEAGAELLYKQERGEAIPEPPPRSPEQERDELLAPGYYLDLHLTARELEVLRLVARGHTDREVADLLVISPRTVNRHLSNIFVKLNVPGRAAAVAYAVRQRLV